MSAGPLQFATLAAFIEEAYTGGWTDGLPVLPPEPDVVDEALRTTPLDPLTPVATGQGGRGEVRVVDVAVASVLAGCLPAFFPVVLAAAQALAEIGETPPTLADASQCVVINGPIRNRLQVNCGLGLYGPGWRANATIGRGVRFAARAMLPDAQVAFGDPGQYTLCFGEDEENSGWTALHVQRGLAPEASAVTVHSPLVRGLSHDRHSRTAEELIDSLVVYARGKVSGSGWFPGEPGALLLVIAEEARRVLRGWTKESVHAALFERFTADDGTPIQPVCLTEPDDLMIVAAGGPAFSATQFFLSHRVRPRTRAVETRGDT
jgi:hypothetical protein